MLEIRQAQNGEIAFLRTLDTMAVLGNERHGQIAMWVTSGVCRTALLDGDIAGYAISNHSFFHQRFIELVLVAKAYRRQGIGLALVRDAGACAGCTRAKCGRKGLDVDQPVQRSDAGTSRQGRLC